MIIENIPDIRDVNKLIEIIGNLGVKTQKLSKGKFSFLADQVRFSYLESDLFKQEGNSLRGSIMILGPLLTRFGKAYIHRPGGDKIGRRRLDTHFEGFIRLGATFQYNQNKSVYSVEAPNGITG